ncbi:MULTISPECIES: hypothetical protein [Roseivirga]|jgi:ABC-type glycerol-3-phosphate transport system substrate-binding protein|uniref:Uncharacterized protein n=1 Tax=Roseivirga thermotolerans TaxID=1758176 RepID=A0ABQ3I6T1_9BACT|nr:MULTISPECIES: hypothetical protein [Roseivirga]MEC7755872.1 hypothetical protein [Bacteroidota bacterium]GHE69255.1 hypothetical protein GCM10011340_26500 [Roseivirga thermotolerans]|tara:strand:- start:4629 stop:4985 length:357 start_codon:yes stop_codon:yes gene_type:complete
MKKVNKSRISAIMALLLAVTIIASAGTPISNNFPNESEADSLAYDEHYLEQIDAYVDQYLIEHIVEFEEVNYVKVYDANQQLIVEGIKTELGEEQLKLLRQADLLSELQGTAYYQINN